MGEEQVSGHLVIGMGQVGTAIAAVLRDKFVVFTKDIGEVDDLQGFLRMNHRPDMLHICMPWSETFIADVRMYQAQYAAPITVIHSTVPVGTSRKLGAVHSPVTGKHPNLEDSVRTFVKWFGHDEQIKSRDAAEAFKLCHVLTEIAPNSETTEAGKLWQTLQYGYLIALQKEGRKFFESVSADPEVAYGYFNGDYSEGYQELGLPFRLPILKDMPGPIGGHCVIPNLDLMENVPMADFLKGLNETY